MTLIKQITATVLYLCLFTFISSASDLTVTDVETVDLAFPEEKHGFNLTVKWENSWHTDKNHDAAWIIFKSVGLRYGNKYYDHIPIMPGTARLRWKGDKAMPDPTFDVADDGVGLFVYASEKYRGELEYSIFVELDTAKVSYRDIDRSNTKAYGIEMVYIPEGGFTLGDPSELTRQTYGFYRSDKNGEYNGLFKISSEDQVIDVGPQKNRLYYQSSNPTYRGDQSGPIPAEFPKGVDPFYIMKYEITQGNYADFLNALGEHAASVRYPAGAPKYRHDGGTLRLENGVYRADRPEQRMNYLHWDDMMAFLDWAGLRPYTEFEYTKAARGPRKPIEHEFPWGTDNLYQLARKIDGQTNYMEIQNGMTEADLSDETLPYFGASYYWVFDLSGSLWEKVITVGDSVGRAFTGIHGDGTIDGYGFANVAGWPSGNRESAGYGYRGGGHYGEPWISGQNPYSPIGFRQYASWSAGTRREAYGTRGARTED